ncbi:hypothetical protein YC2023_120951 [Brassica napus]
MRIMQALQNNLEGKSKQYKDPALTSPLYCISVKQSRFNLGIAYKMFKIAALRLSYRFNFKN